MYGLFRLGVTITPAMGLIVALLLVIIGIWAGNKVEPLWGKDNYRVVIDEVAGMWISMLFAPLTFISLLAGLILFRFFDILKPLYIRRMEKLPGGTGVMMDDVLAGAYSCIALQILARLTDLK
jgi:phosphatidylglycerophosphatase A